MPACDQDTQVAAYAIVNPYQRVTNIRKLRLMLLLIHTSVWPRYASCAYVIVNPCSRAHTRTRTHTHTHTLSSMLHLVWQSYWEIIMFTMTCDHILTVSLGVWCGKVLLPFRFCILIYFENRFTWGSHHWLIWLAHMLSVALFCTILAL